MKKGIFCLIVLFSVFCLPSCALLEFEDPDELALDRGYSAEEESDDCTGRFCDRADTAEDTNQALSYDNRRTNRAIAARDVIVGMTRQQVAESWGEPSVREAAGRGTSGHERWVYGSRYSLSGARTVIFEDGRVAGWER